MDERMRDLLLSLENNVTADDFLYLAESTVEELVSFPDGFEAVSPIIELMEKNEQVDFGMPGALVHFVERFYRKGYEEVLLDSLHRWPTSHTLWMLNRVINGSDEDTKASLLEILDKIANREDIPRTTKEAARGFRAHHSQG